ncbi:hypothetical protein LV457_17130 [Mycobacterium sp. MYCO198283]|uniref:hypothetical protein n=1 Tax=Mycobacterium sp. MYCO198283 TaxID=2883505 RepID=UPI001E620DE6|nr:hypothetical protein [Mycobacterium sp. MYCO198283]MCG5433997.1 hypothetical protein [Mycobacterium sp. MYCO198283]
MPDDLLRFVGGPPSYASLWLWLGIALLVVVVLWYAGVLVWTMPSRRLRALPVVRDAHARVLRERFARSVREAVERHRAGEWSAARASGAMSAAVRNFLYQRTGAPAPYLQLSDLPRAGLEAAQPVLSTLADGQFNDASRISVADAGAAAEELIRTWN